MARQESAQRLWSYAKELVEAQKKETPSPTIESLLRIKEAAPKQETKYGSAEWFKEIDDPDTTGW